MLVVGSVHGPEVHPEVVLAGVHPAAQPAHGGASVHLHVFVEGRRVAVRLPAEVAVDSATLTSDRYTYRKRQQVSCWEPWQIGNSSAGNHCKPGLGDSCWNYSRSGTGTGRLLYITGWDSRAAVTSQWRHIEPR